MEINGKVYRNLEGQVQYLTEKWDDLQNQINDVRSHLTHYVIVDALPVDPEDIDTSAVYLVGPMGTAPDQYYEEWVYVQKADESWMWEKLGDTASVDLSGYLEKMTGTPSYPLAYVLLPNGNQGSITVTANAGDSAADTIVRRTSAGEINVPVTPSNDSKATSKKYVNDNFLAKQTGTTSWMQAYVKNADGSNGLLNVQDDGYDAGTIVRRMSGGRIKAGSPTAWNDVIIKDYADDHYVAKQTGVTTYQQLYTKKTDGSQDMLNVATAEVAYAVPVRTVNGTVRTDTPQVGKDAANKEYVDAVVGQLLYLHDIELVITVDASNKLYVKAYLVSGSATAITSFDRQLYRRIDVQWGAFGPDMANVEAVAVTKLPDTFRQDEFDEPFIGFLYQYISGGNLISGKTTSSMSSTITDTVISF